MSAQQKREMRRPAVPAAATVPVPAAVPSAPVAPAVPVAVAADPPPIAAPAPAVPPRATRVADPNLRPEELGGLDKAKIHLLGAELEAFLDVLVMAGTLAPFPRHVVTSVQPRAKGWLVATENGRVFGVRA